MNKKNIILILVAIFAIIAGLLLYSSINQKKSAENKDQQISEKSETNTLLNFRDKNFEFDYPNYFTVIKAEIYNRVTLTPTEDGLEIPFLQIHILSEDKESLINNSLSRIANSERYRNIVDKNILVGNLDGRMIGNSGYKDTVPSEFREIYVEIKQSKVLFINSVDLPIEDLNIILSSFKFFDLSE